MNKIKKHFSKIKKLSIASLGSTQRLNEIVIDTPWSKNFKNGKAPSSLGEFVSNMIGTIYILGLIAVLVYLTWGAYKYLMSGGDPKAVKSAKDHLTYAIIGMVVIFLSYGIFTLINTSIFNNAFTVKSP